MTRFLAVVFLLSNVVLGTALWLERRAARRQLQRVADHVPAPVIGWLADGEPVYRVAPTRNADALTAPMLATQRAHADGPEQPTLRLPITNADWERAERARVMRPFTDGGGR